MRMQALVVDQDSVALNVTAAMLDSLGLKAVAATDVTEAAERVQRTQFDAIFVAASALKTADLAREARGSARNEGTPIVVLGQGALCEEALEAGGTFFVNMPADEGSLRQILQLARIAVLERRQRWTIVPFTGGVACEVRGYCFSTPAVALSETCIRVRRHPSLVLGAGTNMSFRLPNGWCFYLVGTVSAHGEGGSAVQFHELSRVDRFRLRQFIREQSSAA